MGYRVHKWDNTFKVVEVKDGEVVDIIGDLSETKAKAISKSLNFGGGFEGKIPEFFNQKIILSYK